MKKLKVLPYRRRREGKTDFSKRIKLLSSGKPRLVVRITNQKIISQISQFDQKGDKILLTVESGILKKYGWLLSLKNLPAAYLTGFLLAKQAGKKGIKKAVLDIGLRRIIKGNRLTAFLMGLSEGGLKLDFDERILPSEERIKGVHLDQFLEIKSLNKEKFKNQFSRIPPIKIEKHFEEVFQKVKNLKDF